MKLEFLPTLSMYKEGSFLLIYYNFLESWKIHTHISLFAWHQPIRFNCKISFCLLFIAKLEVTVITEELLELLKKKSRVKIETLKKVLLIQLQFIWLEKAFFQMQVNRNFHWDKKIILFFIFLTFYKNLEISDFDLEILRFYKNIVFKKCNIGRNLQSSYASLELCNPRYWN